MAAARTFLRRTRRRRISTLTFAVFAGLAVGCGDGGTGPKETRIGADGGSATLAEGAIVLTVPPGALTEFVSLTASPSSSGPSSDLVVPGSQYQIGPGGTSFGRLVTMVLSYDPAALPPGVRESELRLYQLTGQQWTPTANSSVEPSQNTVTGLVDRLGTFAAMGLPVTSVDVQPTYFSLGRGQAKQFTAFGRGPEDEPLPERSVSWESSNVAVATVDQEGLVTGVGNGIAEIRALVESRQVAATVRVSDCGAQASIPVLECETILDVYGHITKGDWQLASGWVTGTDPCEWRGVTCEGGAVTELRLRGGDAGGTIPHTISNLTHLKRLDLSLLGLTGVIPRTIGGLQDLESLNLFSNWLSGPLPEEIGSLSRLTSLVLFWNEFTGPIPAEFGDLEKLDTLQMNGNHLSGSIPPELGSLLEIRYMSLLDNQLTGAIPPELGDLPRLETLGLGANQLSGSIPPELGNIPTLRSLTLWENQLTGGIPTTLGNLANLEQLLLHGNQLGGTVPIEVALMGGRVQQSGKKSDCIWVPPGNDGLSIPDTHPFHDADLDGDGKICGLIIGAG